MAVQLTSAQALAAAIQNVNNIIAQITANPKPSYSIDGVSVSWESYFASLLERQRDLYHAQQMADGPSEVRSRGMS